MSQFRSIAFGLTATLLLQMACMTTVPATITWSGRFPIDRNGAVWLSATRQREAILASLRNAGIKIATDFESVSYSLNVRVGSNRGGIGCGSVNNVSYVIRGPGKRLMVIKGRGVTGACQPSVFDDLSQTLANSMI